MKYEILHKDAYPVIMCGLKQGETIIAESDAMIAMSANLDIEGTMRGSVLGGLARRVLAGESFFYQRICAVRGSGSVMLGHSAPGGIVDIELDGYQRYKVQKNGFLAGTDGIQVDTAVQNLAQGIFSREGFFVLNVSGRGKLFVSSFGAIHKIDLPPNQEILIDNGHLVAWPENMQYNIEKASNGWISSLTSGECLVCRFRGPGSIYIQTRNPSSFSNWLRNMCPPINGR